MAANAQDQNNSRLQVPVWVKYALSVEEAAAYYGIGIKSLYQIIHDNPDEDFLLEIGSHYRIKRVKFEQFLDETTSIYPPIS